MKTICLITFGTEMDCHVGFTIGLLTTEPLTHGMKAEGVIITIFKTDQSIERCRVSLQRHQHNFVLLDITNDSSKIPVSGFGKLAIDALVKSELEMTPEQKEQRLFDKIRALGNVALTEEDHIFLKSRM